MKGHAALLIVTCAVFLAGCGAKKNKTQPNAISSQYAVSSFYDVNNTPTYDPALLKDFPRQMDLKAMMTPVKDQGERGTCSFFAATAIAEAAIKEKMKIEVNLSEEYLNYAVKSRGYDADDEGGSPIRNLKVAVNEKAGFLLERDVPYQPTWFGTKAPCLDFESTDAKAPKECFSHNKPSDEIMAKLIPGENFTFNSWGTENFTDIIQMLNDLKKPVTVAIPTHRDGLLDNGNIQYTEEMRAECIKGSSKCGSHIITITGYDLDKEVFLFKNSWSKLWGQEGYGTIPFSVVDKHVYPAFGEITLNEDLKLPEDHAKDYFKLKSFAVNSTEDSDKSILLETALESEKTGTHALITNSVLYKKNKNSDFPLSEDNTSIFELSEEDIKSSGRSIISNSDFIFQDKDVDQLVWKMQDHQYKFSEKRMSLSSVAKARKSLDEQLVIKTVLYIYTDDQGYKPLKTIYHPLNYVHYEY